RLEADPPDLFVGVDAPDFNLGLERRLRARGIRTMHYVSPSIWAWRGERIHRMAAAADHVLCLFPFEPPYYEKVGVPVTWVGHPLADEIAPTIDRAAAREQARVPNDVPVFALLPGSRGGELAQHADLFVRTARAVLADCPQARFLVPLTNRATRDRFEAAIHAEAAGELPLTILFGHAQLAMAAADVVLVASGTATLEAALMRRAMVITYRVPWLTWRIMWPRRYLPYIGLPNVMAGEFVVPEILQHDATPQNLATALLNLLRDKPLRERVERRFESMYTTLRQGAAQRAADAVMAQLGRPHAGVPATTAGHTPGASGT
ncbi:MAG: lipid-A-disaccharide synthase, partial [Burkholderiales bacterium]|nr:lipid-A-disaccharide synthase [Burkholderiales bacterium]